MNPDGAMPALVPVDRADAVFVPHTHWDREWYEPFQVFRRRLVDEIDRLLDIAEADPEFRFTLDGQTAAILDYLEIRPHNTERVRRLVRSGRLAIGPWLILLDEFLCTGETIVRNLRIGTAEAERLGGAMKVGYLPDMFGHAAQMPQILRRAGLEHTALWRGVPLGADIDGHGFIWAAPDGSSVRVEFLFDGYDNGLDILLVPDRIGRALDDYARMTRERWGDDPVLAMAGTDHTVPDPNLLNWLRRAAGGEPLVRPSGTDAGGVPNMPGEPDALKPDTPRPGRAIAVATLEEYVRSLPGDRHEPVVVGELRGHTRSNLLPGVLSVRRSLKQAMALAERTLDEAERLHAGYSGADVEAFLDIAWRKVIESSAHDSVVGSGTDETAEQVHARLREAAQIARAVRDGVLTDIAARVPASAHVVVNPLPRDRTVIAEVAVEHPDAGAALVAVGADGARLAVQEAGSAPEVLGDETVDAGDLERVLRRIHRRELFGRQINSYELVPGRLTFRLAEVASAEPFDLLELRDAVAAEAARTPGPWRVLTTTAPVRTVLAAVPVPAGGTASFRVSEQPAAFPAKPTQVDAVVAGGEGRSGSWRVWREPVRYEQADGRPGTSLPGGHHSRSDAPAVDNGLLRWSVGADGTLDLHDADGLVAGGLGRIVDGGDRGDTYNYGPPADDLVIERPEAVSAEVVENGPVRWRLRTVRTYHVPTALAGDLDHRAVEVVPLVIETLADLHVGERLARLTVRFVNAAADHRVRLHLPLPQVATESQSEGQFAVTRRGLSAEGDWGERALATFPATSFVAAGGLTVLLDHATEYEVTGGGKELALTLVRAVGAMSRNIHPFRDEPAGSEIPVPGAQSLGEQIVGRFAILPSPRGWRDAGAVHAAEHFRAETLVRRGLGPGSSLPPDVAGLRVDGESVAVSCVRRTAAGVELRLIAFGDEPTPVVVSGDFRGVSTLTLLGDSLDHRLAPGRAELTLDPWEIRSILLT